jgi:hypothetical protein
MASADSILRRAISVLQRVDMGENSANELFYLAGNALC